MESAKGSLPSMSAGLEVMDKTACYHYRSELKTIKRRFPAHPRSGARHLCGRRLYKRQPRLALIPSLDMTEVTLVTDNHVALVVSIPTYHFTVRMSQCLSTIRKAS
ncbi:unnamed protein product [Arctia plantaginis]|uniref:Uncharacterized protein n=1 Tax=Arctia plantaginis TaxID=874455 RepID=A0A8S0YN16_ARCPL|nr:unnamed protein product [Arctia plantaginis]